MPEGRAADPLSEVRHRAPSLEGDGVDYGLLTDLTGFSVKLAWILGHGLLSREFDESGITPHRFSVLEVIGLGLVFPLLMVIVRPDSLRIVPGVRELVANRLQFDPRRIIVDMIPFTSRFCQRGQ